MIRVQTTVWHRTFIYVHVLVWYRPLGVTQPPSLPSLVCMKKASAVWYDKIQQCNVRWSRGLSSSRPLFVKYFDIMYSSTDSKEWGGPSLLFFSSNSRHTCWYLHIKVQLDQYRYSYNMSFTRGGRAQKRQEERGPNSKETSRYSKAPVMSHSICSLLTKRISNFCSR